MQFLVLGVDGPTFGTDLETDLHEAHSAYMDEWADVLVARGPTLSADGESHTGSLHVVDPLDMGPRPGSHSTSLTHKPVGTPRCP